MDVPLNQEQIAEAEKSVVKTSKYRAIIDDAFAKELAGANITTDMSAKDLQKLFSSGAAATVRDFALANPDKIGSTVTFELIASSRVDGYLKGRVKREDLAEDKNLDAAHLDLADQMQSAGILEKRFNWAFITGTDASDSRPEQAGIGASMIGSLFMMLVVLFLSLPIGVAASIYLEEFAPQNKFTDLIEVNISNLAAVPSIVFGILGLAVFIQFMHLPQSAPLVGGLVLTLMTLPTIIISTRASFEGCSAEHPRCGPWHWRLQDAVDLPPCPAAGNAGHSDRHDHRSGTGAWGNRSAAPDRDGRLHRLQFPGRCRCRFLFSELGHAGPDLRVGETCRPGLL